MKKLIFEEVAIPFGGKFDSTKAFSPFAFQIGKNLTRLFYIGANSNPGERKGYRVLTADSKDGINFKKLNKIFIPSKEENVKHYSPAIIKLGESYFFYFAVCENGSYKIRYFESQSINSFKKSYPIALDVKEDLTMHTLKFIKDKNTIHGFFTASKSIKKIFSKKFPKHDFGEGFKIWHGVSINGKEFTNCMPINIKSKNFVNIYGHFLIFKDNIAHLFFTGFDGSVNRIYVSKSSDFKNFSKPRMIIEPNIKKNELGIYSCSLLELDDKTFRIYYSVRYFDNRWNIRSAKIEL
jgi:hypothetical protein